MQYKFKPGDRLIYKPTNTPFIVIKVELNPSDPENYAIGLANGLPGVPLKGNIRYIHSRDIFKSYEPEAEAIRLLFKGE